MNVCCHGNNVVYFVAYLTFKCDGKSEVNDVFITQISTVYINTCRYPSNMSNDMIYSVRQ